MGYFKQKTGSGLAVKCGAKERPAGSGDPHVFWERRGAGACEGPRLGRVEPAGGVGGAPIRGFWSESPPTDPGSHGGVAEAWQELTRHYSHWPLGVTPPRAAGTK